MQFMITNVKFTRLKKLVIYHEFQNVHKSYNYIINMRVSTSYACSQILMQQSWPQLANCLSFIQQTPDTIERGWAPGKNIKQRILIVQAMSIVEAQSDNQGFVKFSLGSLLLITSILSPLTGSQTMMLVSIDPDTIWEES